jgi:type VII secretion integral membrane protein EccD
VGTTAGTGFCRVTVVAPDSRVDVALPQDVALADLRPRILSLSRRTTAPGEPAGWHLVRVDGTVLDAARTLADQRVLDGEVLLLRPFARSLPPAVYDDVADAVAAAVGGERGVWSDGLLRVAGLSGAAVLLALTALLLWCSDPVRHDTHGPSGILAGVAGVLITAFAVVRGQVYGDRGSAVALGLGALPLLLVAGTGVVAADPGQGPGRLQFMLGCVAVLLASTVLVVFTPQGDAPFVAAAFAAATGTLAAFAAVLSAAPPARIAAVCAVAAIGATAFLPGLSVRFARLPIGHDPRWPNAAAGGPVDVTDVAARARRGHELLLGLVGGVCVVVLGSAAVLGLGHSVWAQTLCAATGVAAMTRARLFRRTAQVLCLLAAGLGAIALVVLGLALNPPPGLTRDLLAGRHAGADLRTLWLTVAVTAGAAVLTAIALIVPRGGLTPSWGRLADLAEAAVLLSLVPLCLAVLDVYAAARAMASG